MATILNRKNRLILTVFDPIIGFVLKPFVKPRPLPTAPRRILMIRLAHIGDAVLTFPAAEALKKRYPNAAIYFLTSRPAAELLRGNPFVDEILIYDTFWFYPKPLLKALREHVGILRTIRAIGFDLTIDFRADIRNLIGIGFLGKAGALVSYGFGGASYLLSKTVQEREGVHKTDFHLDLVRALGADRSTATVRLYLDASDRQEADSFLARNGLAGQRPLVGIHAGGRVPLKLWPRDRFSTIIRHLLDRWNARIILTGAPDEQSLTHGLNVVSGDRCADAAGKLSLRQLAAVMERMDLYLCNDTSTLHLAAAVGTPTLSLFGPSLVGQFAPRGDCHTALSVPIDCRPCDQQHCSQTPPLDWCMTRIRVEEVIEAIDRHLASRPEKIVPL